MDIPSSPHKSGSISMHELNQLIAQSLLSPDIKEALTKNLLVESHNHQITADGIDRIMRQVKTHHAGSATGTHIDTLHERLTSRLQQKDQLGAMHHEPNKPFIPPGHAH